MTTVQAMLTVADLTPEDIVYDLGCGDGRIVKMAYERWGADAVGIEINERTAALARKNCEGLPDVKILHGDARKYNLRNATVVTMYLDPSLMHELIPKVDKTARVIVSYLHPVPGHESRRIVDDDGQNPIYVWTRSPPSRPQVRRNWIKVVMK
jgi:predicted RNA methylase